MLTISIKGLDELIRMCRVDLGPAIRAGLEGVGALVHNEIARAPGPVRRPIQWASEKQRRYVMAQVRRYGPWVRNSHPLSQRLVPSWTVETIDNYHVRVGNRATYGPWVQSAEHQQPMHAATGWRTDEGAIQLVSMSGDVEKIMGQAIGHALEKAYQGG